jgi:hypothetical protein
MKRGHDRDWGFFKWAAAGFLAVLGFVTSFGWPVLIGGIVLFIHLSRRPDTVWPADLGLLAGAGLVCLLIAGLNVASGDLSPTIWAAVGGALTGGSTFAFWWLRCRPAQM